MDNFFNYVTYRNSDGDVLRIQNLCLLTYPCQHHLTFNGETETWFGTDIYRWFRDNNMDIPEHFTMYESYVNKIENPTSPSF